MDETVMYMMIFFVTAVVGLIAYGIFADRKRNGVFRETIASDIPHAQVAKEKSKKKELPQGVTTNKIWVKTEQDFMGIANSRPFVMWDENWNQMPLNRTITKIPREHLTRMYPLAYLAGKVSVMAGKKETSLLLIIILFAALAGAGVSYMQGSGNQKAIETQQGSINSVGSQVSNLSLQVTNDHEVIQAIAIKLNVPLYASGNNSIPTVG